MTKVGDVVYSWDARGNLLSDGTFTYTYNAAGRMVRAQSITSTFLYTYTADGLRVAQSVGVEQSVFAWDTASALPQVLATSDGALYLYGLDLVAQRQSDAWQYPLVDALGSIRQWTDDEGAVTYAAGYTPFGEELWREGSAASAWGYTGEWQDHDVGLLYLRARWYAPGVGRFTQRDPLQLEANLYTYAAADPVNRVDPQGLLSNATIMASFHTGLWEDVMAFFDNSGQNWGYLKMLQDAKIGDRVYGGPYSWASYLGTIECYDRSKHNLHHFLAPWPGGAVLVTPGGEVQWLGQEAYMGAQGVEDWYFLNGSQSPPPYTTKTDQVSLPDYVVASFGPSIGAFGFGPVVSVDRYGYVYGGGSGGLAKGLIPQFYFATTLGWINQQGFFGDTWRPNQDEIKGFLEGWSVNIGANFFLGLSASLPINDGSSPSNPFFPFFKEAIGGEYVIGTPSIGFSVVYMRQLQTGPISRLEWDSVDMFPVRHGYDRQSIISITMDSGAAECGCSN